MNSFQNEDHASFGTPDSHSFHADAPTSAFACPTQLSTIDELFESRRASQKRYETFLASLFEKYGRDTSDIADEIDLSTGKIVVNRGHLLGLKNKNDVWTPEDETENSPVDTSPAFASSSSKLTKGENQTAVEVEKLKQYDIDIEEDVPLMSFFRNEAGSSCPFNRSSFVKASYPKKKMKTTNANSEVREQDSTEISSVPYPDSSQLVTDAHTGEDAGQISNLKNFPHSKPMPDNGLVETLQKMPLPLVNEGNNVLDSQANSHTSSSDRQDNLTNAFQTPEKPAKKDFMSSKRTSSFSSTKKRNFVSLLSMVSPRPSFVYKDSQNFVAKPVSTSQISTPMAKHHSKENCEKAFCFECLSKNKD
ncbi:CENP-A chaperone Scm3 [Schizosaccharomyces octosporus yFS286]|uniref:CENP-A chaperone Scm3 n=1 Tax=Schizosaccharomyces octosporus (strain yFS286) TaxID=483514 RepID=S9RIY0_SCHOY|nr:CENP-A chaperone Scm3 [Schizosaccharomyces octosporus yFS286]EPX73974.1 CENP-A chaperone Scm3 [Schizosaccharomyces octosporus yFS286]